jgi:PhnB protein
LTSKQPALIPYLSVERAPDAIQFYVTALGAVEGYRLVGRDGRVGHAELTVAGAPFKLAEEYPEIDRIGPLKRGGPTCSFTLQVDDVDGIVARAVAAGARLERPVRDEFYGERVGVIVDPFGHRWSFHKQIETLSDDEVQRRFKALEHQT